MAINKVVYDGDTLIDLTSDTVTPSTLVAGTTAHNAAGVAITGTADYAPVSHTHTSSEVGLGNVPNVSTNNQTPTYTAASSLTALTSGEKLSVAFGKIAKAVSDLISHIGNKSNPHGVTASQISAVPTSRTVNGKALSANISLSASDVGASTVSTTVTATLAASSWSGGNYTLSVTGVTATSNQEILPATSITAEQLKALQGANIQDGGQSAGKIILKAFGTVPTINIPIRVIVRGDA